MAETEDSQSLQSIAREVYHELLTLDTAVYQAIEATPTPLIDAPLRRLSNTANHARLYMGIAAVLFAVGGKKGRRAAVTGMAAVGIMPREIRLMILCGGLVLGGLIGADLVVPEGGYRGAGGVALPQGMLIIEGSLAIIAIGATITVIQRVLHVRAQAAGGAGERAS